MNNKVALVTVGTSGIGKEIVLELLEKGWSQEEIVHKLKETPLGRLARGYS